MPGHRVGVSADGFDTEEHGWGSAGVQGAVLGVSDDGGWVYFVATGVLENTGGVPVAGAVAGAANLYVRHEGITRLVAVLSGADSPDWGGGMSRKELTS